MVRTHDTAVAHVILLMPVYEAHANPCTSHVVAGRGIPVEMHREHHVYVPELIFGHLLTSSNYDDDEKKSEWYDSDRWCIW